MDIVLRASQCLMVIWFVLLSGRQLQRGKNAWGMLDAFLAALFLFMAISGAGSSR